MHPVIRHNDIVIDRKTRTISVGVRSYKFRISAGNKKYVGPDSSAAFDAISHLLLNGHTTDAELFDVIYGRTGEGGPDSGPKMMLIHFINWGHMLDALGLQLSKEKMGGVLYRFLRTTGQPDNRHRLPDKRGTMR